MSKVMRKIVWAIVIVAGSGVGAAAGYVIAALLRRALYILY